MPKKQPKRGRLWLNDGSCAAAGSSGPTMSGPTTSSRTERRTAGRSACCASSTSSTRRCLAIVVAWRLKSDDVLHCLADLFVEHGLPEHIRSDNGPGVRSQVQFDSGLGRLGVKTLFIEPGSPWENGYCESFNSKLRDELLNGEIFTSLHEAEVLIEELARHYNHASEHPSVYAIEEKRFC